MQQQPRAASVSPTSGADLVSVCSGKEEEEAAAAPAPSRASRKRGGVLRRGGTGLEAGSG